MDLALTAARIFTGDPQLPWAEAVLIHQEKIIRVGRESLLQTHGTRKTRVLRLPGRLIVPGLVDGHAHFCFFGQALALIDLKGCSSLARCREKIQEHINRQPPGQWLIGRGWDEQQWSEKREPTRHDLDDLSPANPVILIRADGHTLWANSLAMREIGVFHQTPTAAVGRIERDPTTREPTGILREAGGLFRKFLSRNREDWKKAALAAQHQALKTGLTGVHSCETLEQYEALAELEQEERLKIRIYHLLRPNEIERLDQKGLRPGSGSPYLWIGHIKLFADGSLGSKTALLYEPYEDDPQNFGLAVTDMETMVEQIRQTYAWGGAVAVHAIGDKGVAHVLEAIERARTLSGLTEGDRKDRIEHVQLFRVEDLPLFRSLRVTASVQPVFSATDWRLAMIRWGERRCRRAYAWKTLIQTGIPVQFGSDAPFDRIDPIYGLQAAVTRQTPEGTPPGGWFPEERISLAQALEAFTRVPAWTSGRAHDLGMIAPGKQADLTVFAQDLFATDPQAWPSIPVEMTIIGGQIVYPPEGE